MIDFGNLEVLEKMVWNFILNDEINTNELRPTNGNYLSKEELINIISPKYFNDDNYKETFKLAYKFYKQYNKIPNKKELKSFIQISDLEISDEDFNTLYQFNLNDYNYDFLYKYVRSFILKNNLNYTLYDLFTYLKTSNIDPDNIDLVSEKVRNHINSKLSINFSSGDSGLNFFNLESHIQIPKNGNPSGFDFFDKTQGGGWNPKSLVVFQGRPKVGKSIVLGNIAARSFLSGNITGLITVELPERQYIKRLGSNILDITSEDYSKLTDFEKVSILKDKIESLKKNGNIGELWVKEFATGSCTAIDIENYFLRLENKINKKFKVIVVDYLNLLKPIEKVNGLYEKIKLISEELRGVAMRNEWCIITATQIRREEVDNFDLGMDAVSESFGLIHTVDALYGLMRRPLENRMKIKVIANRDNGYEESYKFYTIRKNYFKLVEEIGPNSEFYSDDEDINNLTDQIRQEYNDLNNNDDQNIDMNYDDILNSI